MTKKTPIKKESIRKPAIKKVAQEEVPKKTHGTYMDENGVIDWDKLKQLLKTI